MAEAPPRKPRLDAARRRIRAIEDSLETSVTPWVILTAVTFAATALWMIGACC